MKNKPSSTNKEILKLAIPNIVSNVSIPLLSTVDTVLMGGLSMRHLGAIGIGTMIFNTLYWNFGFLRMGTTGMTAQAYGAEDRRKISDLLYRGIFISLVIAILILLFKEIFFDACIYLFNMESESVSYVRSYFNIRIWAAPATLGLYVLLGWLFGMQNATLPLIITILINIVNIIASYYAVKVLNLDMKGVAIGTVIAQYVGLLITLFFIIWKYSTWLTKESIKTILKVEELLAFLKINGDIFLRTVCLTFVFSFFYSQSFKLGAIVLAANVILQQFINWMSYGIDGFAYASESLIGKYKGANDENELRKVLKLSFYWGGAVALLFSAVFYFFGHEIMLYFSEDPEALALADELFVFLWIFPIIAFASYIWDGIYVGLLASRSMRNSMGLSLMVFLIVFYSMTPSANGYHIWFALCIFLIARAVFQTILYIRSGFELQ